MSLTYAILIFGTFLLPVFGQDPKCVFKETCRECIQEFGCVWCIKPDNKTNDGTDDTALHCVAEKDASTTWCPAKYIVSPKSSHNVVQNRDFSSNSANSIQFKPQYVKYTVRKGEKIDVHFQYKQAENYPVDLYYIMDLSKSMDIHRKKLGKLGVKLAEALKNLTTDVRLGFGSFIDKVDLPFVSTVPEQLKKPCAGCDPPYSFKNHIKLSTDYEKFKQEVTNANVSGNLDSPEGGLDAIMQAIVCKNQIGWRNQARHLIVFSTDAQFHIAGDGKLAGVIEPNDGKCHMLDNEYKDYLKYDYPSVSQINYVAKQNNVNLIFAIVKKDSSIRNAYQKFSERIENSNFGELQENDNNNTDVINLVVTNYKKIVQSMTLSSNASNDVDVKFSSNCRNPKPNGCGNVHVGEVVNFTATIRALNCSSQGSHKRIISIKPEALEERFIIELDVICDCACSSSTNRTYEKKSRDCDSKGDLVCGVCKCPLDTFGRNCQCNSTTGLDKDTKSCQMNDQAEICSGQGECKCGKCDCNPTFKSDKKIYGKFCQCNNYSCKRDGGKLCSGRGICDCGDCKCFAGYTGDSCQCPDTNATCIAPGKDLICSGKGTCNCGKCACNTDSGHSGTYCEECTTCPAQRCEELRHCVECQAYQTGLYNVEACSLNCTTFQTKIVDKFEDDDNTKKCRVLDQAGCLIIFQYTYDENKNLIVEAQKEKLCAGRPNVLAWILGVIGTIVIAGLIMLIVWKVCTTVHDRREYAKFENEKKALQWHNNTNPLYREATSTFANPVYNRSVSKS